MVHAYIFKLEGGGTIKIPSVCGTWREPLKVRQSHYSSCKALSKIPPFERAVTKGSGISLTSL